MARVILTEQARAKDRRIRRFRELLHFRLRESGWSMEDLAKLWGVTQQGANYRIRHMSIPWEDLCRTFEALGYTPDEIVEVMR